MKNEYTSKWQNNTLLISLNQLSSLSVQFLSRCTEAFFASQTCSLAIQRRSARAGAVAGIPELCACITLLTSRCWWEDLSHYWWWQAWPLVSDGWSLGPGLWIIVFMGHGQNSKKLGRSLSWHFLLEQTLSIRLEGSIFGAGGRGLSVAERINQALSLYSLTSGIYKFMFSKQNCLPNVQYWCNDLDLFSGNFLASNKQFPSAWVLRLGVEKSISWKKY